MGKKRDAERRSFEDSRAIDLSDAAAVRFWCERLGATAEDIAEAVRQVGPNATAVALKLDAPDEVHRAAAPGAAGDNGGLRAPPADG